MMITTTVDRTRLDPNRLAGRLATAVERTRAAAEDKHNRPLPDGHEADA